MYMPSPGFETDSDLGGRKVLRHLFEIFISAGENWMESSIVINARSKTAKTQEGQVRVEEVLRPCHRVPRSMYMPINLVLLQSLLYSRH